MSLWMKGPTMPAPSYDGVGCASPEAQPCQELGIDPFASSHGVHCNISTRQGVMAPSSLPKSVGKSPPGGFLPCRHLLPQRG